MLDLLVLLCRYAWGAISEWQVQRGMVSKPGMPQTAKGKDAERGALEFAAPMRRAHSASCMTQLAARHADSTRLAAQCVTVSGLALNAAQKALVQHFSPRLCSH